MDNKRTIIFIRKKRHKGTFSNWLFGSSSSVDRSVSIMWFPNHMLSLIHLILVDKMLFFLVINSCFNEK